MKRTIKHQQNKLRTIRLSHKHRPTANELQKMRNTEDRLQQSIMCAKAACKEELVAKFSSQPQKFYNHLKKLTNGKCLPTIIAHNSRSCSTNHDKAQAFNDYFRSVFTHSIFILPAMHTLPTPTLHINNITIDKSDVYAALTNLNTSKSPGPDAISHYQ